MTVGLGLAADAISSGLPLTSGEAPPPAVQGACSNTSLSATA
jgi:hypothetical protein